MKTLALALAILATAVCEVPPPYSGSFRPSQPLILPARGRIQTVYGPPKQRYPPVPQTQYGVPNIKNVEFLEDLLGPIIPPRTVVNNFGIGKPQNNYVRPRIVNSQPQTTYGVPTKVQLPQMQYGAPNRETKPFGTNVNQNWLQIIREPQVAYGVPSSPETFSHRPLGNNIVQNQAHSVKQPQMDYGFPRLPQNQFGKTDNNQLPRPSGNNIWQNQPQVQYGAPDITQNTYHPNQRGNQQEQQCISGASNGVRGLQNQYGVPDQRGIESFERFQQQRNQIQQQPPTEQYLPIREAVNFRDSVNSNRQSVDSGDVSTSGLSEQYLPIKEATSFKNPDQVRNFGGVQNDIDLPNQNQNVGPNFAPSGETEGPNIDVPPQTFRQRPVNPNIDIQQVEIKSVGEEGFNPQSYQPVSDRYLPPTTTPRMTSTERTTTKTPSPTARAPTTTVEPTEGTVRTTEASVVEPSVLSGSEDETSGNPNVAVATAVAGGGGDGQTFYLVQPDGRFQRVVYKKTQEVGDQEDEYTANYNFQNIQADPNLVYTPLITLG